MLKKSKVKGADQVKVTFSLPLDNPYGAAAVVGDFNNWDPTANKMAKRANNRYSTAVTLAAGQRYAFRYITEDGTWFNEEEADGYEVSEHGSQNCIIET
jgi:1,4-alpha-glucan branching enzyme